MATAEVETLTNQDKEQLLNKLDDIQKKATQTSNQRYGMGLQAFQEAIRSDDATHELYLKCIERVRFENQKLKAQDFREWKRRHKERTDSPGFRAALRHQLNWLLLTIEASAKPDEMESLGPEAMLKIDTMFKNHELLNGQKGVLKQNVLETPFAKAYDLNGLEAKDWPLNPLELKQIYEKVVMPSLRKPDQVDQLREAWNKRIRHEGLMVEKWSTSVEDYKDFAKKQERVPDFDIWLDDDYLKLLWAKEIDCYAVGDEKKAALSMIDHIKEHVHHKYATIWLQEFTELLTPEEDNLE